ncbi:MAG TPA: prenyltransferase/squalene oxidase repeat-containing protein [Gemmata sp.]|jgi:hypothetical protein|nr:prenyltransferase/squalene oxidase repeat-containing protein [Gemmata sp.]
MNRLFRSLLALTGLLGVAVVGTQFLRADNAPAPEQAPPPRPIKPLIPVVVTDNKVETKFAVKPKELSAVVKKGLEYLIKNQQEDGGWNQGGGWRVGNAGGGRVEGPKVEDPSDIGNTSLALLALLRAGNSPVEGQYKDAAAKGLAFVLARVEKAESDSLYITDVRGTQLQSKIGPYVDTFLTALVLAELKGKAGPKEKQLVAALEKTMTKIVKNQTSEGGFANNGGWAPILSVAIANKSIARAKQNGVAIDDRVLDRAFAQSQASANGTVAMAGKPLASGFASVPPGRPVPGGFGGIGGGGMMGMAGGGLGGSPGGSFGDAGVSLYRIGQGAGNSQDVVNSLKLDGEKARQVLKDAKATQKEKDDAQKKLDDLTKAEAENVKVQGQLTANLKNEGFTAGFGSNGGEEFLSFLNISETLVVKGGKEWEEWDAKMVKGLEKAQDKDGSWAGQHCITGKTFCTAGALLVLMVDRTPFAVEVLSNAETKPASEKK